MDIIRRAHSSQNPARGPNVQNCKVVPELLVVFVELILDAEGFETFFIKLRIRDPSVYSML
jgi:hypothetical protein